jgi:hypothetical protein
MLLLPLLLLVLVLLLVVVCRGKSCADDAEDPGSAPGS